MKKIICILLSVVIALSCFSVVSLAGKTPEETEEFDFDVSQLVSDKLNEVGFKDALANLDLSNVQIPSGSDVDLEALIQSGALNDVNYLGLSLDFLYNSTDELFWSTVKIDKNDLAIAVGNLNAYLRRLCQKYFLGEKFYTNYNANKICNFIGHLLFENFEDVEISFPNGRTTDKVEFYSTIADRSGLSDIISRNWCPYLTTTCNYKPLLYTLGVNFQDFPAPERDIENGAIVARILIETVVKRLIDMGPINYILDILWAFSRTYNLFMIQPIKALFKVKLNTMVPAGDGTNKPLISEEELSTFKGLFNLIANDNKPNDFSKLQFITPPSGRFAVAKDKTELFLYVLIYLNLVGRYKQNGNAINLIEQKISASPILETEEKNRVNSIIRGLFLGDTAGMVDLLEGLLAENFEEAGKSLWERFKQYLGEMLSKFTGIFDRIYQSLKEAFGV